MWYNTYKEALKVVITISRQPFSCGDDIAKALSEALGIELITRDKLLGEFLPDGLFPHDINMLKNSAKYYLKPYKKNQSFLSYISKSLHDFSKDGSFILLGFGSSMMFANDEDSLHIRIIAPKQKRIKNVMQNYSLSEDEAEQTLINADKKQRRFITTLFGADVTDPAHYDIVINTKALLAQEAANAVLSVINDKKQEEQEPAAEPLQNGKGLVAELKNDAETEFAKLLNMYGIAWKYEPKTFPIEWDSDGNVTSAFRPDFYLTDFDTFIELTTMQQRYVTQKNKKVKMLKKLYPNVNIKIVYKKDFHSLVERLKPGRGD